jgi:hypothetical protein
MSFVSIVSNAALREALPPLLDQFLDPTQNITLSAATAESVHRGRRSSILVPAVNMAVSAALGICEVPSVQAKLPTEVLRRARIMADIATEVTQMAMAENWILMHYAGQPQLQEVLEEQPVLRRLLVDPGLLPTMVESPFTDAGYVAGGAKRKLDQVGATEPQSDIVGRSSSLLLFAQIHGPKALDDAEARLGRPYISPDNYVTTGAGDKVDIAFTDEAEHHLRALMVKGRGCPAAGMYTGESPRPSVLRESWGKIVGHLLCSGATLRPD